MADFYKILTKRKLEDRSHLTLEFPQTNGRYLRTYIPMLENCQISEEGTANLSEYNLLARSGSLFSYLGAKSRSFNITFKISLLHLMQLEEKEGLSEIFKRDFKLIFYDKEEQKKLFAPVQAAAIANFGNPLAIAGTAAGNTIDLTKDITKQGPGFEHARTHRQYYQALANAGVGTLDFFSQGVLDILTGIGLLDSDGGGPYARINKSIDLIIFWINLIRATTLNNSSNTTLGSPIVRLTHGIMYNNIPCVTENYSIRIIDESGYESQTLMPKQVEINLSLRESRVGNFGKFKSTQLQDGDNHVGWEAIIENNNMDPYNGLIQPV